MNCCWIRENWKDPGRKVLLLYTFSKMGWMVMVRLMRGRNEEKGEMSSHHLRLILTEKYLPVYSEIYNLMIYKYYTSKVCLSSRALFSLSLFSISPHPPSLSFTLRLVCHVSLTFRSFVCRSNTNFKDKPETNLQ